MDSLQSGSLARQNANKRDREDIPDIYKLTNGIEASETPVKKQKSIKGPYHINAQLNKPAPIGQPEVWSNGREALCSALPYFKCYQGGTYASGGFTLGCLIDRESGLRDVFDDQVIITNIGGGKTLDENRNLTRQKDQQKNHFVKSFIRSMEAKQPVGVVAGKGNKLSPAALPHVYNVLDWFQVTAVWCEKVENLATWRVRLEKIELSKPSWWAAHQTAMSELSSNSQKATEASCTKCKNVSKETFRQGWACLHSDCDNFFKFSQLVTEKELEYSPEFVQERNQFEGPTPQPLAPPFKSDDRTDDVDSNGNYEKGFLCPKCGCCSRRKEWLRWTCENESDCSFSFSMPVRSITLSEATLGDKQPRLKQPAKGIEVHRDQIMGHYKVDLYHMPGPSNERIGLIAHFKADKFVNEQPDGPNALFYGMQHFDLNLKRNPAYQEGTILENLANHFGANWGAPYKFGVNQVSKPFSEAPSMLHTVVQRLIWAGEQIIAIEDPKEDLEEFNELLTLAYLQGQKIGYHDDGESTLGPTVASISLGSSAKMSWKLKKKPTGNKSNLSVLEICLKHGDLMVMHGALIQKYYVHTVDPAGPLRFGLTSRRIRIDKLDPKDRPYAIEAGTLPPAAASRIYDGDAPIPTVQRLLRGLIEDKIMTEDGVTDMLEYFIENGIDG